MASTPFSLTPTGAVASLSTVIGLFTSTKQVDVVRILNQQTMQQVFNAARPMGAEVKESAKVSKYPLESGYISYDNRVSNPTEINMAFFIPSTAYATVYPQIRTAWLSATLLSVQTRTGTYKNMIIESMPHEENVEMFSGITMLVKFSEFIIVSASASTSQVLANYSPAQPQAQNTLNTGLIQGLAAASSVLSYFHAATVVGL